MYVSNVVTSLLNAYRVLKISKLKINFGDWIIKPFLSGISALVVCKLICELIIIPNSIIYLIFKIGVIGIVYIILLFLFGISVGVAPQGDPKKYKCGICFK